MRIQGDLKLDFDDVLIVPKRSTLGSRSEVDLTRNFQFRNSGQQWSGIPIIAANMDGVGSVQMARALAKFRGLTALVKNLTLDELTEANLDPQHTIYTCGARENDIEKLVELFKRGISIHFICLDVANGYTQQFVDVVEEVRMKFPLTTLIAGNVVSPEMTEQLILSGADIVKVGIGPGSVCETRIKTGVGYPQLSAIAECADAAHGLRGHIIGDGGCRVPGDIAKAFAANADFVMLGSMLAGHTEGGGNIITKFFSTGRVEESPLSKPDDRVFTDIFEEKQFVKFYGMSSDTAMNKHNGGVAEYRTSEGRTVEIPFKGPVDITMKDVLGGVRSTCTYVGAATLKELSKRTTFVRVNKQFNDIYVAKG